MKRGIIAVNGYFENAASRGQTEELRRALEQNGVATATVKTNALALGVRGEGVYAEVPPCDFCVFLDKDVAVARMLEKSGVKLFNGAEAIRLCDDKMLTFISLSGEGIRMPESISSPLMYKEYDDGAFLDGVERRLGYPTVVKKVYGSMGAGVFLARNRGELESYFKEFRLVPHLYQKFIGKGGTDLRIVTVGGKAVAAMRRSNGADFRSNIELGGRGECVSLTENQRRIAERASALLGLEYAGVDILSDETGDYLCEVNSNAFFGGIERATGVNVAKLYADRICGKIYRRIT
ncbi:MAG: RimK family alpha-L-glutamate ligase [Bacillota bacterium]|nr:MAG: RimK family alpha-L-glutamate ligase [Bacillota bacterium]